ncbi:VOC family protein [Actinoallomurus purpureus]|uniref:VOC family protein n=1 Tax=Actinoallomurus purpureus TaxID=478114 RepID=UPI00209267E4|nr:VOC family protein [Actinoallomurus purpureus]MCO6006018.1 VOC family protein [Actinoallomurus purpureus]
MSIELDHIIIPAHDKHASATFLADILGVPIGEPAGPFVPITVSNGVTLDYMNCKDIHSHHCAFLVSDEEFDAAFARVQDAGVTYYADPGHAEPGEIDHRWNGRGVYFNDPNGHNMEILTRAG